MLGATTYTVVAHEPDGTGVSRLLLEVMHERGCRTLVFSSSATVYGEPKYLPIDEAHPTAPTNPYGWNKLHIEQMLSDMAAADAHAKWVEILSAN